MCRLLWLHWMTLHDDDDDDDDYDTDSKVEAEETRKVNLDTLKLITSTMLE